MEHGGRRDAVGLAETQAAQTGTGGHLEHQLHRAGVALDQVLEVFNEARGQAGGVHPQVDLVCTSGWCGWDPVDSRGPCRGRPGLLDLLRGGLEGLGGLHHQARLAGFLVVNAPTHQCHLVNGKDRLVLGESLAEHEHLYGPLEVVQGREHHVVATAGTDALGLGDDPSDGDPILVTPLGERSKRAVHAGAQRLAHRLEGVG